MTNFQQKIPRNIKNRQTWFIQMDKTNWRKLTPVVFYTEIEKIHPQIHMNLKGPKMAKQSWKRGKIWRTHAPTFKTYHKVTVITIVWYWHTDRHIDQWNQIQSPEINPHTCGKMIFDTGTETIQWGCGTLFNKWCWEDWISTSKTMKFDPYMTPYTKISSKGIKDLHVKAKTIKLLEA